MSAKNCMVNLSSFDTHNGHSLLAPSINSSANVSYEEVLKYASSIGLFIVESLLFNADFVDLLNIENRGCVNIKH